MKSMRSIPALGQISGWGEKSTGRIKHEKVKVGDIEFDSLAEHDRYLELRVMERAGIISDLECHPKYEVLPKQETPAGKPNFKPVVYTPDFRYKRDGKTVVEEVKSEYTRKEKDYVIRRKLILYTLGIYVEEIVR